MKKIFLITTMLMGAHIIKTDLIFAADDARNPVDKALVSAINTKKIESVKAAILGFELSEAALKLCFDKDKQDLLKQVVALDAVVENAQLLTSILLQKADEEVVDKKGVKLTPYAHFTPAFKAELLSIMVKNKKFKSNEAFEEIVNADKEALADDAKVALIEKVLSGYDATGDDLKLCFEAGKIDLLKKVVLLGRIANKKELVEAIIEDTRLTNDLKKELIQSMFKSGLNKEDALQSAVNAKNKEIVTLLVQHNVIVSDKIVKLVQTDDSFDDKTILKAAGAPIVKDIATLPAGKILIGGVVLVSAGLIIQRIRLMMTKKSNKNKNELIALKKVATIKKA